MIAAERVRRVTVVGTGAIGASWALLVLARGLEVVAADPAPDAEARLRGYLSDRLGSPALQRLKFEPDLRTAAREADLVLENGPERLDAKRDIFATLDQAASAEVVLASSSSGLPPSSLQDACAFHPERVAVAHPFNPPHLVPLVEVVAGERTSRETVDALMGTFRSWEKRPIHVRREIPGHVANRLQAALWREAYHLVDEGVVSVADVDTVVSSGPGLRWALLGPFATQHLSGGPGGLQHVLDHLGPPMVEWWEDLGTPELTPELTSTLVSGVRAELAGQSETEVSSRRDAALEALLRLKERHGLD